MRAISVLLFVLLFVVSATATLMYFQPNGAAGKDSYTTDTTPNDNYGGVEQIFCGHVNGLGAWAAFIEFDGLDDSQYQGATVNEATLSLWVYDVDNPGQFQLGACSSAWNEYAITWNNMPSYHATVFLDYPTDLGFMQFDVTDWVQNWLDGTWANNGLGFFDNTGTYETISFRSSDYSNSAVRPVLMLNYSGSAIEESTWGQIKATF